MDVSRLASYATRSLASLPRGRLPDFLYGNEITNAMPGADDVKPTRTPAAWMKLLLIITTNARLRRG
jgi:hypothetical protein